MARISALHWPLVLAVSMTLGRKCPLENDNFDEDEGMED